MNEKLDKMDVFFDKKAASYDSHMIDEMGLNEFYNEIQKCLPHSNKILNFLDLGCGTGLQIEKIFINCPNANITGIDLSSEMLKLLEKKFLDKINQIDLINDSYFDVDFGIEKYDYSISTYSLHHFDIEQKKTLYRRIYIALKEDGIFIEGDYTVNSIEEEKYYFSEYRRICKDNKIENGYFHYDTPLYFKTQEALLYEAGFKKVAIVKQWESTSIFICYK